MDNNIKEEVHKIDIPEDLNNRVILGMDNAKRDMEKNHLNLKKKKKKKWGIKGSLLIAAAVLLLGISLSISNSSPALAQVVSKIPYLNSLLQSKPVMDLISEELDKEGFIVYGIDTIYKPEKEVRIRLADDEGYDNNAKKEVEKIAEQILKSKGYNAYSINVGMFVREEDTLSKEEKKDIEVLEKELLEEFKEKNYKSTSLSVDPVDRKISVNIGKSKEYYEQIRDEVEITIIDVLKSRDYTGYEIALSNVIVKINPSGKSALIEPSLSDALLSKKEYKVTGISFTDTPLKFYIKTSIMSNDSNAKKEGEKLDVMINEFFETPEIEQILGNDPYEVIIYSKDKKRIN